MAKIFTDAQQAAIVHLAHGQTQEATAELVGVSRKTIGRWCKDPEFRKAIKQAEKNKGKALKELPPIPVNSATELRDIAGEINQYYTIARAIQRQRLTVGNDQRTLAQQAIKIAALKPEDISLRDAILLDKQGNDNINQALQDWGNLLGIQDLMNMLAGTEPQDATEV